MPGAGDPRVPELTESGYRALVEQIPAVTYLASTTDPSRAIYVSPQAEALLGYPLSAWFVADNVWIDRFVHPDDRERIAATFGTASAAGRFAEEYRMVAADGRSVWVRDEAAYIRDGAGTPLFWGGSLFDISAQKEAQAALAASESKYRTLVEHLPAIVYIDSNDEDPRSLYVSPAVEEILGRSAAWYLGHPDGWLETVHPDDREPVRAEWERAVRGEHPFDAEYRFVRPDGLTVWVRDTASLVRGPDGRPLFWQGVLLDVTARREAEEALRRSEERHRALVENIPAVIYEMGPDDERRTLYVSPHVEEVLGYSRDEWLDQPDIWIELLHPDDREIELAAHDLHNETGEPWSREYRLVAADGRSVWVRDQAVLQRDDRGRPLHWQGVMLDVTAQKDLEEELRRVNEELEFRVLARTTELSEANEMMALEIGERKRVEGQLREAEERYRQLVEHIPGVIYLWDVGPRAEGEPSAGFVAPQIEALLGFTPTEWLEPGFWLQRVHPHDLDAVMDATRRSGDTGEPFSMEYRYLARDGSVVWVLDQASLLSRDLRGQPKIFQGVMLDITARKDAESAAAEAETRYRVLAEQGPAIAYIWELTGEPGEPSPFAYVSPRIVDVLGYPPEAWTAPEGGELWWRSIHPDDRTTLDEWARRAATGEPWSLDYRIIAADGRIVWVHDEGRVLRRDEHGRPRALHGSLVETTGLREAMERLRASEARQRLLLESMPAIPWTEVFDPENRSARMTYIGPQVERILGYTADELLAEPMHLARMLHPEDRERVLALNRTAEAAGEPWRAEYRVFARDGSIVWLRSVAELVVDELGHQVWQGVTFDVTAERLEAERRRSARVPEDGVTRVPRNG